MMDSCERVTVHTFYHQLVAQCFCICCTQLLHVSATCKGCRDSSVGIATRYGLDGPGIESRWWAILSAPVQTGPGAHLASCTMTTGSFPGGKERPERDADPSSPSSAVGHERVEL